MTNIQTTSWVVTGTAGVATALFTATQAEQVKLAYRVEIVPARENFGKSYIGGSDVSASAGIFHRQLNARSLSESATPDVYSIVGPKPAESNINVGLYYFEPENTGEKVTVIAHAY